MPLFNDKLLPNILPGDGAVFYHGQIFSGEQTALFYNSLLEDIVWKNDEVIIYGKRIITKRKMAWYGDDNLSYTYSGIERIALPFTETLQQIKSITEEKTKAAYNSCLLNLYHNGNEGMGWHSDDEKTLVKNGSIASLSFGASRRFLFKHKTTKENISLLLENGSLLAMEGETQTYWLHNLPKTTKVNMPRINLTFRTIKI